MADYTDSLEVVRTAIELAHDLLQAGKNDEAFDSYTKIIEERDSCLAAGCHKELSQAYNERGYIRYLRVDFGNAVDDYTMSIHLDENHAVAYYNRGQIHYRLGRYCLALEDFKRALALQPDFMDARLNMSQIEKDLTNGYQFNAKDPLHSGTDPTDGSPRAPVLERL